MLNFDKIYATLTLFCHFTKAFFAKQLSDISCLLKTFNSWYYQDHINSILYLGEDFFTLGAVGRIISSRSFCKIIMIVLNFSFGIFTQSAFTYSKLTKETLEKGVKYVQS